MEWIDPRGLGGGGWIKFDDLPEWELEASKCRTVGYVYSEDEENIVLLASLGFKEGKIEEVGDGLVIPQKCVRRIIELIP